MKRDAEKGSALLIVFVFAAIVAIMLYTELPVAAFESKRRKEQIAIDHGKEYAHAVKLFVRKVGRYPSSLDELQNTNNMRFLRHKFKDPLTGQDDWRLLHAGPGGVLLDSKVKPATSSTFTGNTNAAGFGTSNGTTGSNNNNNNNSSNSTAQDSANKSNSIAGSVDFPMAGSIAAEASASTAAVPAVPQRPPAVAANGAPNAEGTGAVNPDENPGASLVPPIPGEQTDASGQNASNAQGNPASGGTGAGNGQPGSATGNSQQASATGNNGQPGDNPNPQNGQGQNSAGNTQNMVNRMTNGTGQTGTGAGTGVGAGAMAGGGIAGVAIPDKVTGAAIKTVNDQHKYALWEFYYDPTQDTLKAPTPSATQPGQNNGTNNSIGIGGSFGSNSNNQSSPTASSSTGSTTTGATTQPSNSNQSPPQ